MDRSSLGRGLAVLAVAALAVAVVSPAFSATPLTRAKVKMIARKQAIQVLTQRVVEIDHRAAPVTASTPIFTGSGLTLRSSCIRTNEISLTASTTKADSSIYATASGLDGVTSVTGQDLEGGLFDPGVPFDLLLGHDGDPMLITFEYDALDGSSVSGIVATDENSPGAECQARGHVIVS
jgi:hypothetical protein